MKKMLAVLFAVVFSAAVGLAHDNDDDVVRWRSIVGVITTPGVNNPVAGINAGSNRMDHPRWPRKRQPPDRLHLF